MADRDETHLSTSEARAGASTHMTRVILPVSLGLVILVFLVLLFIWR